MKFWKARAWNRTGHHWRPYWIIYYSDLDFLLNSMDSNTCEQADPGVRNRSSPRELMVMWCRRICLSRHSGYAYKVGVCLFSHLLIRVKRTDTVLVSDLYPNLYRVCTLRTTLWNERVAISIYLISNPTQWLRLRPDTNLVSSLYPNPYIESLPYGLLYGKK